MREKHFLGFWAKLLVTDLSWTVTIVLVTDIFGLQGFRVNNPEANLARPFRETLTEHNFSPTILKKE
jgi:hypothetical protein